MTDIECGILQGSFISPVLFLIYTRDLFIIIKTKHNVQMLNFIDDITIYAKSKSISQNCRLLSQITQEIFQ